VEPTSRGEDRSPAPVDEIPIPEPEEIVVPAPEYIANRNSKEVHKID